MCAILAYPHHSLPCGLRLDVKTEPGEALGLPFHKPTELAAHLIRAFQAPAGVQVMVLCDADARCRTVVQAGRDRGGHGASTLNGKRRRYKQGWRLTAGRYGKHRFRRRRPTAVVLATPQGSGRSRVGAAGWLQVSTLGPVHGVFSRPGRVQTRLGLVTDDQELSAAGLMQTDEIRWAVARFFKDSQPLRGLGHAQHRSDRAAVTPRPLVCLADALLPHLRLTRHGVHGQRPRDKAAAGSLASAQDQRRCLLWEDLVTHLQETHAHESVLTELDRLRVA